MRSPAMSATATAASCARRERGGSTQASASAWARNAGAGEQVAQRYRQGQEEQLGALGLIVNTIVLYNTIYTQRALDHLAESGQIIDDADIERLSPLGTDHI